MFGVHSTGTYRRISDISSRRVFRFLAISK